jgi:hypothetical protein
MRRDYGKNRTFRFHFRLSINDKKMLDNLAEIYRMTRGQVLRVLIREAAILNDIGMLILEPDDPPGDEEMVEIMDIEEWAFSEDPEVIKYAPELITHTLTNAD